MRRIKPHLVYKVNRIRFGLSPKLGFMERTKIAEILSRNLSAILEKEKRTQTKTGEAAGTSQSTVGRIINFESSPGANTLEKVAAGFNLEPWQLMVDTFDPYDPPAAIRKSELEVFRRMQEIAKAFPH